jgi:TPR repeat protein
MLEAQVTLADMYYLAAENVPRSFEQAAYWYEKAATAGDSHSRTVYGSMLRFGTAVAVDQAKAYALLLAASRDGHAKAMCQLADMLAAGEGVPKQPVLAGAWYLKAASLDETAGKDRWEILKKTLTSDQIATAESEMAKLVVETKAS